MKRASLFLEEEIDNIDEKEMEQRNRSFNGLTAKEWASVSQSVVSFSNGRRNEIQKLHGATYPESLCDRLISMYTSKGDTVLDTFLGTGTTVVSAIKNGRTGIGIELSPQYFEFCKQSIKDCYANADYKIYNGDCEDELDKIEDGSIQLTLTSPPYSDLIHHVVDDLTNSHKKSMIRKVAPKIYSNNKNDLGNMPMDEYKEKVTKIMRKLFDKTKQGGYNIWVVKDFRDIKHGIPYVDLHSVIAECGQKVGFTYHDLIIWNQSDNANLVVLGYPSVFYCNQVHSFIVVLRKS